MSELSEKLQKIAASIDSLLEKIASEEEKNVIKEADTIKPSASGFGSLSTERTSGSDPLLDFILS